MNIFYGESNAGVISEAVNGLIAPKLILMFCAEDKFESCVETLEKLYPDVPSIGSVLNAYSSKQSEGAVTIIAFTGNIPIVVNAIKEVSTVPALGIGDFIGDIDSICPGDEDTLVIDMCSGNDKALLSVLSYELKRRKINLIGAGTKERSISVNGRIYEDIAAYAIIKNDTGKIKTYCENKNIEDGQIADKIHFEMPSVGTLLSVTDDEVYADMQDKGNVSSYLKRLSTFGDSFGFTGAYEHFDNSCNEKAVVVAVFE